MATELGKAYVQIIPSAKGIGGMLSSEIAGEAGAAGHAAGLSLVGQLKGVIGAAAIGKFLGDSISTGAEFDKSMSQVAATMGLTMDEMADQVGTVDLAWGTFTGNLRDYAQEMGANTAFSATESADALNYMALAGYDVQTSMEMLPNVLNMAAAGNMDLARASDMVTDTQTAFGLSLDRTSQMVDEMAKAASTGNTSVEQLGDAFLIVGGLTQELNGGLVTLENGTTQSVDGVQELEIALTAMANAGIKGSEAGTHMRNMLLKLASPTGDGATAMEKLGLNVFDAAGNMRSLSDIFGDLSNAMAGNVTPAFKNFYDQYAELTPEAVTKLWKKDAEDLNFFGVSIVDNQGKLKEYEEVFNEVQEAFAGGLSQEAKIGTISDLFNTRDIASAEALLNAIDQDWDAIGASILEAEGAAQQMADTQLDNLAGDVTIFKSALEGVQIAISDLLTPALRDVVQLGTNLLSGLTSAIKDGDMSALAEVGTTIITKIGEYIQGAPERLMMGAQMIEGIVSGITENLPQIMEQGQVILGGVIDGLLESIPSLLEQGQQIVENIIGGISEALPGVLDSSVGLITNFLHGITENLPSILEKGIEILMTVVNGILDNLPKLIEAAGTLISEFAAFILVNLPTILDAGVQIVFKIVEGIIKSLPEIVASVTKITIQFITTFAENAPKYLEQGFKLIVHVAAGIIKAIPELLVAVPQVVAAIIDVFIHTNWLEIGINIIEGIASGIVGAIGTLIDAAIDAARSALNAAKDFLGIASPSKEFAYIGKMSDEGFALGIKKNTGVVDDAISELSNRATAQLTTNSFGNLSASQSVSGNDKMDLLLELLSNYLPEIAENKGVDAKSLYNGLNRQLGWALS